jgi:CxxC motif-containing protein
MTVTLDENKKFVSAEGNACARGLSYAESECTAPVRSLASTVLTESGKLLPVKSASPIPKEKLFDAMREIRVVKAPDTIRVGDVVLENLADTGVALVATASAAEL